MIFKHCQTFHFAPCSYRKHWGIILRPVEKTQFFLIIICVTLLIFRPP